MVVSIEGTPPHPLRRPRIDTPVSLGVRAWDTLVPAGRGQRVGVFAGSGVGKSTLMGMVARSTSADVNVVALIGERGREVREFVEADLGRLTERLRDLVAIGFDRVYVHHVGQEQLPFLDAFGEHVLPGLKDA